jgi:hypothetical protein
MAVAGIKQLSESSPEDTELFIKALIQRLRSLTPRPGGLNDGNRAPAGAG